MRKQLLLFFTFTLVLSVVFFVSCSDEQSSAGKEEKIPFAVERNNAKQWYEAQMNERKAARTRASVREVIRSTVDMEPIWEESFRRSNERYKTMEVLVEASKMKSFASQENYLKAKETNDSRYARSLTRLVVLTDKKTGETIGFTMTIMPSVEHLEKTNFKAYKSSYLKREKDFSGYIYFHSLDGQFANGWKYKDGKITHSVSDCLLDPNQPDEERPETRGHLECWTEIDYVWVEICNQYCWRTENTQECDPNSLNCEIVQEERGRREVCKWVEDDDPPTDPGGGTPGGYDPNEDPFKKKFDENIKLLINALKLKGINLHDSIFIYGAPDTFGCSTNARIDNGKIHICQSFFYKGYTFSDQVSILYHEASHIRKDINNFDINEKCYLSAPIVLDPPYVIEQYIRDLIYWEVGQYMPMTPSDIEWEIQEMCKTSFLQDSQYYYNEVAAYRDEIENCPDYEVSEIYEKERQYLLWLHSERLKMAEERERNNQ